MGKHTNITTHAITNSATRLNICHLFGNNLFLNSKDKRENKSANKSNDNVISEKELL